MPALKDPCRARRAGTPPACKNPTYAIGAGFIAILLDYFARCVEPVAFFSTGMWMHQKNPLGCGMVKVRRRRGVRYARCAVLCCAMHASSRLALAPTGDAEVLRSAQVYWPACCRPAQPSSLALSPTPCTCISSSLGPSPHPPWGQVMPQPRPPHHTHTHTPGTHPTAPHLLCRQCSTCWSSWCWCRP